MVRAVDTQVAIVTTIGSAALLTAAAVVARSIARASRGAPVARAIVERTATYHVFVELWEQILRHPAEAPAGPEAAEEMLALDRLVMMYGSAGIVRAQAQLRASTRVGAAPTAASRAHFINALLRIRRELGSEAGADLDEFILATAQSPEHPADLRAPTESGPRVVIATHV